MEAIAKPGCLFTADPREPHPTPDSNSVLGKVRLILEVFGLDDETLSLSELARRTGLAKASVHRLSQELVHWGLLERRNGEYRLGMRLFEIGQRVPRQRILRDLARPLMIDLVQSTNETVHLAVVDGLEVLYLEKVSGGNQISRPSRVAGRMPLHCTATGKALLAFGRRALLDEVMAAPLARVTPRTTVAPGLLAQELQRARELGYAAEFEQARIGYMSVAIPLAGATGATVAALSVTAPTSRANADRYAGLLSLVGRRMTKLLSAQEI
ncbi:IclR family transcriptional regulator [Paractinoplanes ferrugineus]|uniref:IclR family transcriptional regulator n=1 Tax=Paractinoplanes ferrugineus TaxID=113564 RepID=A0A919MMZ1_9ACTN|nr:IclR family transcriptional regulator [Actinoplanes ferrugineus]GIE13757.1 IclR family transcriptional regulator [Actinoplanes ferrugineus]